MLAVLIQLKILFLVFFEPTDMKIAEKPFTTEKYQCIKFITPNLYELRSIAQVLGCSGQILEYNLDEYSDIEKRKIVIQEVVKLSQFVNNYVENVIVTLGSLGVIITNNCSPTSFFDDTVNYQDKTKQGKSQSRYYRARFIENVVNVSGAGDSFVSGFITAMLKGKSEEICVSVGLEAAYKSLLSDSAVPDCYFDETHSCWTKKAHYENVY